VELTKVQPVFRAERFVEARRDIQPLLEKHWKEVAHYPDIHLNVDWYRYVALEEIGALKIFTARSDMGQLLGYAISIVQPHMHYRQSLQAVQDVLFISEDHRGFGKKFIEWCDDRLRDDDVQAVYHHVKVAHNFAPMLERMGYELIDRVYGRRLETCWELQRL